MVTKRRQNAKKRQNPVSSGDDSDSDSVDKLQQIMLLMKQENGKKKRRRVQKRDRITNEIIEQINSTSSSIFYKFMDDQAEHYKIIENCKQMFENIKDLDEKQSKLFETHVHDCFNHMEQFVTMVERMKSLVDDTKTPELSNVVDAMKLGQNHIATLYQQCVHEMTVNYH